MEQFKFKWREQEIPPPTPRKLTLRKEIKKNKKPSNAHSDIRVGIDVIYNEQITLNTYMYFLLLEKSRASLRFTTWWEKILN